MAFCTKCGNKNDDDAAFCKSCGAPIPPATPEGAEAPKGEQPPGMYPPGYELDRRGHRGRMTPPRKDFDKECEEECEGTSRSNTWFWGLIIILIGAFILFEAGIKNIDGVPDAIKDLELWWIIPVLIGIMIISAGLRVLTRTNR
jgi:hypothetical protein